MWESIAYVNGLRESEKARERESERARERESERARERERERKEMEGKIDYGD